MLRPHARRRTALRASLTLLLFAALATLIHTNRRRPPASLGGSPSASLQPRSLTRLGHHPFVARAGRPSRRGLGAVRAESVESLRSDLLGVLEDTPGISRGQRLSMEESTKLVEIISRLSEMNPTTEPNSSPLLPGNYQLMCVFKPGANVSFTDLNSWRRYLTGTGPSPVQSLVTGNTRQVNGVYQMLDIDGMERFENIVQFSDSTFLNLTAGIVDKPNPSLIRFRFEEGNFIFTRNPIDNSPLASQLTIPYPVPFKLLSLFGDETIGSLDTVYLDEGLRIAQGNKGSFFIFKRVESLPTTAAEEKRYLDDRADIEAPEGGVPASKLPVVICPAQFGVPPDYYSLQEALIQRGHMGVYTAELSRPEWLKIVPATLTKDYWTGELKPNTTLQFYYDAITKAYQRARKMHPESKVNFVGHSIGGWILRCWLKDHLTEEEQQKYVASVTTLGTPHNPPPENSIWKAFDQTRGLLKFVNEEAPGAYIDGVRYTCVVGNATKGRVAGLSVSKPETIESAVAFVSYLPLCGNGEAEGDGIVPVETALMGDERCNKIVIDGAKHSAFLPSPGPSIKLPDDWLWYGSESCMDQWANSALL